MASSMLFAGRPDLHPTRSFDAAAPLVDLAPASPSSASDSDDSEYLTESSRPSSPKAEAFKHSIDNPAENDGVRTTKQGKDWRGASHIHKKTFWERKWSEKIMSSALMDDSHHVLYEGPERDPVPSVALWRDPAWMLPRALIVPALQQISMWYGYEWSPAVAFVAYFGGLVAFFTMTASRFNRLGKKYGLYNQEERGRDRIPDEAVDVMGEGIIWYFTWRVGCLVWNYYDPSTAPVDNFSWSYIVRWQAWFLVMDYFFYCYHRATHEVDFLWSIHGYHHKAKHPTLAHAVMSTHAQHFLEIMVIPTLSTYVIPLSFHEQFVLYLCLAHIETMGHTGIRIHAANPNTWLATIPFGADLTIEDHDLHHRHGKSGKNYGKMTRMWDLIFGTMEHRKESHAAKHKYW